MKKYLITAIFIIFLIFTFVACGKNETVKTDFFDSDIAEINISENADSADITINGIEYKKAKFSVDEENASETEKHNYYFTTDEGSYFLNNCYGDPSYMREAISYTALEKNGVSVPNYTYANVTVNGENKGIYILEEAIDQNFIEKNISNDSFSDKNSEVIGNLYKPANGCTLRNDTVDFSDYKLVFGEDENFDNFKSFTEKIEKISNEKEADTKKANNSEAYKFLDVDTFLNYIAFNYVFGNFDSLNGSGNNYYIYEKDGCYTIIPCDMTMALGGYDYSDNATLDEPYDGEDSNYPLISALLSVDEYKQKYYSYVQNYIDFANEELPEIVTELDERIGIDVKNCKNSFYIYDEYLNSIASIESAIESADESADESAENTETGKEETTTGDTSKSSDIQQTTEKSADTAQTTENSNNTQQTTNSVETTTVATNSEGSAQAVSSETQQKKKVVSDSYTSSQAIGLKVTSPADSKHGTIVERGKTTTENTTSTEVSNDTTGKKNVTYSKIYEKQDFSILDYISERTDSIKNELSAIEH